LNLMYAYLGFII